MITRMTKFINMQFNSLHVFILASSVALLSSCGSDQPQQQQGPPPAVPVTVTEVQATDAQYYDEYPATVVALNQTELRAQVTGYVTGIYFKDGDKVRKGQRLRISASGRVSLGRGRFSTPGGLTGLSDQDKLMRNEATGALIAVIGDDNDDFILVGPRREFVAQRDGVLFLGVNEGDLADNTGTYDIVIEAEAIGR
jgi:hypothetical protein